MIQYLIENYTDLIQVFLAATATFLILLAGGWADRLFLSDKEREDRAKAMDEFLYGDDENFYK